MIELRKARSRLKLVQDRLWDLGIRRDAIQSVVDDPNRLYRIERELVEYRIARDICNQREMEEIARMKQESAEHVQPSH